MAKRTGMGGDITVGASVIPVSEWSANFSNEVQDVTDTGSNGWVARLKSTSSCEASVRAFWGGTAAVLSTVLAIGTTVTLTLTVGGGSEEITGSFIVSGFTMTNNAKNAVEFSATLQSTGEITVP